MESHPQESKILWIRAVLKMIRCFRKCSQAHSTPALAHVYFRGAGTLNPVHSSVLRMLRTITLPSLSVSLHIILLVPGVPCKEKLFLAEQGRS